MLSSVYARDPQHFRQGHAEVQKIFQNNVSWPKNYRPTIHEVVKPPAPKTKEKLHYENLKEKHKYELQALPDWEIDNVITDLESVCQTENAFNTYKNHGWRSNFIRNLSQSRKDEKQRDQDVREACIRDLIKTQKDQQMEIEKAEEENSRNWKK